MRYSARKFVQKSYDRNDEWGKQVFLRWVNYMAPDLQEIPKDKEDYKVDILMQSPNKQIAFEIEVKHGYPFTCVDDYKFDTVSFLGRKKKYGEFWYVIVCAETEALLLCSSTFIYKEEHRQVITIATNERNGLDELYRVPKTECYFYANTETERE